MTSEEGQFNDQNARDFDGLLFGTIEDVLRRVFSELSAKLILQHMERDYLKREEIPRRLVTFTHALRDIFGQGSVVLEKLIFRSLYSRLGLKFEEEGHRFTD